MYIIYSVYYIVLEYTYSVECRCRVYSVESSPFSFSIEDLLDVILHSDREGKLCKGESLEWKTVQ